MMFLVHRETRVTDTLYQFFHHLKFELCFLDFSDFLVVYIEDVDFKSPEKIKIAFNKFYYEKFN